MRRARGCPSFAIALVSSIELGAQAAVPSRLVFGPCLRTLYAHARGFDLAALFEWRGRCPTFDRNGRPPQPRNALAWLRPICRRVREPARAAEGRGRAARAQDGPMAGPWRHSLPRSAQRPLSEDGGVTTWRT